MSHKRGRDKRAKAKRVIRTLDRQDMDRLMSDNYMMNTAFFAAKRLKMKRFYFKLP